MIMNPKITNTNPPIRNWVLFTSFNFSNIIFIFDGNKAYKIPSMKRKRPKAIISSFILSYCLGFMFPKNLKNSLSGERINDVSPPIKAVS